MLYASTVSLTPATATPSTTTAGTTGVNEVQKVTLANFTSGTITITYDGDDAVVTVPLVQADVQTAIDALGGGDIVATVTSSSEISLEFTGALAETNVDQVTVSATGLFNSTLIARGQGDTALCHCVYLHSEDAVYVGGIDSPLFPVPDLTTVQALELDLLYQEELYASGSGTLHILETGLSKTPDL